MFKLGGSGIFVGLLNAKGVSLCESVTILLEPGYHTSEIVMLGHFHTVVASGQLSDELLLLIL